MKPKVYADFHNADTRGRLRLTCVGTMEDLAEQQVELREGLMLTLYSDDADEKGQLDELLVDGVVAFSREESCWVATIDWAAIHHASDDQHSTANGNDPSSGAPSGQGGQTQHFN
jgi:hypothetical protein